MRFLVTSDEPIGEAWLTNEGPQGSYGAAVLQVTSHSAKGSFGPSSLVGDVTRPETLTTAADLVLSWAMRSGRTAREIEFARSFLQQWPEGPQIPRGEGPLRRRP